MNGKGTTSVVRSERITQSALLMMRALAPKVRALDAKVPFTIP
jgi:hypothetical protein